MSGWVVFSLGVIAGICGVCLYCDYLEALERRRAQAPRAAASPEDVDRIYDPLYEWVALAERRGTISAEEAERALDALLEAEAMERQFQDPGRVAWDGPGDLG